MDGCEILHQRIYGLSHCVYRVSTIHSMMYITVAGSGKYGDFEHFLGEAELLHFAVSHSPAAMDRSDFLDHLQMKRVGQLDIHCLIKRVALTKGLD